MQGLTSLGTLRTRQGLKEHSCLQATFFSWMLSRVPGTHSNKQTDSFTDVRLLDQKALDRRRKLRTV